MPFSSLGLLPSLLRAINEKGYPAPTPIQTEAIPAILRGEDVIGSAQTGSGKGKRKDRGCLKPAAKKAK